MNKQISDFKYQILNSTRRLIHFCSISFIILCIIAGGCEKFPGDEEFYEVTVAPEKLLEIEKLILLLLMKQLNII